MGLLDGAADLRPGQVGHHEFAGIAVQLDAASPDLQPKRVDRPGRRALPGPVLAAPTPFARTAAPFPTTTALTRTAAPFPTRTTALTRTAGPFPTRTTAASTLLATGSIPPLARSALPLTARTAALTPRTPSLATRTPPLAASPRPVITALTAGTATTLTALAWWSGFPSAGSAASLAPRGALCRPARCAFARSPTALTTTTPPPPARAGPFSTGRCSLAGALFV